MYVSSIPGRLRIRTEDQTALHRLTESVAKLGGVFDVQHNPRTGSLLIHYMDDPKVEAALHKALKKVPGSDAALEPKSTPKASNKAANMTIAKRGMLSSLGLAMLFALIDREDGHIFTGAMFLGFLSYHLYGYRKRVLA
ncbi:HMA2 domain-containing protein [Desulfonatronum sp. SC1]|uniref:HMA2 domain-containing protein n=1 Tax=Desulfonatronum sp. SC1 TaxID=2109626 RepID=UPI000D31DF0A|nr:hypothetical protein [Desulfonatronum sp. SC1]PTN33301.1 hypothetical protein C6366_14675 [Desulfonatronum sp. SC1]